MFIRPIRLPLLITLLIAGSLALGACGETTPTQPTPTALSQVTSAPSLEPTTQRTSVSQATSISMSTAEVGPTETILSQETAEPFPTVQPDDLARDLERFLIPQLPATPTPDAGGVSFGGLDGIHAFKITDGPTLCTLPTPQALAPSILSRTIS